MQAITVYIALVFLFTALGFPFQPSFGLYYSALLASLIAGFLLFADTLVGPARLE